MDPSKKVNTGITGMYPRQDPNIETSKCPYHNRKPEDKDPHHHIPFDYERKKIYNNILEVVGNTPVVRLNSIPQQENVECQMFVKCEFLNPGGSLKDRIGVRMVQEAEREGKLKKGDTLIEATSGNTGIGLSLTAAVKQYDMHITMPEKMSNEKVDVLKCLGAKIHKTPTEANFDDDDSHIATALKLREKIQNSHILDQYTNPGNPLAHYDGTGSELCHQFDGQLDYIFIGTGTGGTINGIGRKIKEAMPKCKVIGVDPHGSILAMPQTLNTQSGNVLMEGIGYDFVPRTIDRKVIDDWVKIDDKMTLPMSRRLVGQEGLLCGGTSGGTVAGAIEYLRKNGLDKNKDLKVCCIAADNIRNYLTKFVSQYYMVEKGLATIDDVVEPNHPLKGKSIDELNLKVVPSLTEKSTISEALAIFKQGFQGIPVFQNGENYPSRGLLQGKFMECIVNKSLKGTDSVSKTWTQEFSVVKYESMDQALLQRFLERREAVLLVKQVEGKPVVYQATPADMIHLVVAN